MGTEAVEPLEDAGAVVVDELTVTAASSAIDGETSVGQTSGSGSKVMRIIGTDLPLLNRSIEIR